MARSESALYDDVDLGADSAWSGSIRMRGFWKRLNSLPIREATRVSYFLALLALLAAILIVVGTA